MRNLFFFMLLALFCSACASKGTTVVLIDDPDGKVGQAVVSTDGGEQALTQKNQSTRIKMPQAIPESPRLMSDDEISERFAGALKAQPERPEHFLLYFVSGTTDLDENSLLLLQRIKEQVSGQPLADIRIIGHTDTVGAAEANAELALDRAREVARELVEVGVDERLLRIDSHGEGNPLVVTEDNVEEPRNRRVEVVVRH
jgi:outer membrane protein OmpA-like peptidoglycan-associated protein